MWYTLYRIKEAGETMSFDVSRLDKLANLKSKKVNIDLTDDEISFMSNIFNAIIDSDDYEAMIKYLAGIHGMRVSDIKFIRNVYAFYLASNEEKLIYNNKLKELKKEKRKNGFVDLTAFISFMTFVGVVGISLAFFIYNLL